MKTFIKDNVAEIMVASWFAFVIVIAIAVL
jgi:hypothetical protein